LPHLPVTYNLFYLSQALGMRTIILAVLCGLVAGCTITKTPEFVGGDRTSGVVRLAYDLPPLQNARVDQYMAQNNANRACQAWGYATAQSFGNPITTCTTTSASECLNEQVTTSWLCQGQLIQSNTAGY
jgi:hypothetical protein